MTPAELANAAVTRDAQEAVQRLTSSDLLIAAAHLDAHGKPHLRPIADRLAAAAAELSTTTKETHDD